MKTRNNDISEDLVRVMFRDSDEFNKLLAEYDVDMRVMKATRIGLLKSIRQGDTEARIRAIKLIGVLRLSKAEEPLLEALKTEFPVERLHELEVSTKKTLPDHRLFTSLLTALVLIGSEEGSKLADHAREQFKDTWIGNYIKAVKEHK